MQGELQSTISRCRSDLNQIASLARQLEQNETRSGRFSGGDYATGGTLAVSGFASHQRQATDGLQRIEQIARRCEGDLSRVENQVGGLSQFGSRPAVPRQSSFGAYGSSYQPPTFSQPSNFRRSPGPNRNYTQGGSYAQGFGGGAPYSGGLPTQQFAGRY